jgi:hypothetical protein
MTQTFVKDSLYVCRLSRRAADATAQLKKAERRDSEISDLAETASVNTQAWASRVADWAGLFSDAFSDLGEASGDVAGVVTPGSDSYYQAAGVLAVMMSCTHRSMN